MQLLDLDFVVRIGEVKLVRQEDWSTSGEVRFNAVYDARLCLHLSGMRKCINARSSVRAIHELIRGS